jgi:porin
MQLRNHAAAKISKTMKRKTHAMKQTIQSIVTCALLGALPTAWGGDRMTQPDRQKHFGVFSTANWLEAEGMTANWFGARPALQDRGLDFFGGYTAEVWGNTRGGLAEPQRDGALYTGLLDLGVELNLEKFVGWTGGSLSTTWLWLHGRDASEDQVGNFLTISNIAGFNTLRMLELWFQQNVWDDKISLRVGQLAADSEFIGSDYAGTFINAAFGWPAFIYKNLPGGGPGYPMGTLGARLALNPVEWFTFQSAVFQGNVYDQNVNRHGFRWRLDGQNGFLFLNEAQVRWNHGEKEIGLPGQAKSGIWIQTGQMADALHERTNSGNYGLYFVFDQMIYREGASVAPASKAKGSAKSCETSCDSKKSSQGLGWFSRYAFTPEDRNILNFYFDTGLTYKGLIPGRDEDALGLAIAYGQLGDTASVHMVDEDGSDVVGAEIVLEATYQIQITPWCVLQPDVQYIINPGGTRDVGNALVIGARCSIAF